jgi:FMN-dependent NADH-azoreductase
LPGGARLSTIFGFVGITDSDFIYAQPTGISALREAAIATAITQARDLATDLAETPREYAG